MCLLWRFHGSLYLTYNNILNIQYTSKKEEMSHCLLVCLVILIRPTYFAPATKPGGRWRTIYTSENTKWDKCVARELTHSDCFIIYLLHQSVLQSFVRLPYTVFWLFLWLPLSEWSGLKLEWPHGKNTDASIVFHRLFLCLCLTNVKIILLFFLISEII